MNEDLRKLQAKTATDLFMAINQNEIDAFVDAILKANRIYTAGFGRAGNVVRILGMNCVQLGKVTYNVGDNNTPAIEPGDLLIVGSRSGNTKTITEIVRQAKDIGATVALISSDRASAMGKMADLNIVIPRIPIDEEMGLMTKGLTYYQAAFMLGDYIQEIIMRKTDTSYEEVMSNHNSLE